MKNCLIYFNKGQKCIPRLMVSLYSAIQHNPGLKIVVLSEGKASKDTLNSKLKIDVEVRDIGSLHDQALVVKPMLNKFVTDYQNVMLVDSDTLICSKLDTFFDYISKYGFVVTNFANWKTSGSKIRGRIGQWATVAPTLAANALKYSEAVNTGVVGWQTGNSILPHWEKLTIEGWDGNCSRRMVDELACQLLLNEYPHFMADETWNSSCLYTKVTRDTKIIHYHGSKHTGDRKSSHFWKKKYREIRKLGLIDGGNYGDRALKKYLKEKKEWIMSH